MKGSLMLWTCEIQGAQHMIFKQKKKNFLVTRGNRALQEHNQPNKIMLI